jgi:hypothetical protein
MSSRLA